MLIDIVALIVIGVMTNITFIWVYYWQFDTNFAFITKLL